MGFFSLFVIICFFGEIYSAERLWICVSIHPKTGEYEVSDAGLEWGKWIEQPYASEVGSPVGKTPDLITSKISFCSSGREHSASGTEGWVQIHEKTSDSLWTIRWDRQWSGADTFSWSEYDSDKLAIIHRSSDFRYDFSVSLQNN